MPTASVQQNSSAEAVAMRRVADSVHSQNEQGIVSVDAGADDDLSRTLLTSSGDLGLFGVRLLEPGVQASGLSSSRESCLRFTGVFVLGVLVLPLVLLLAGVCTPFFGPIIPDDLEHIAIVAHSKLVHGAEITGRGTHNAEDTTN